MQVQQRRERVRVHDPAAPPSPATSMHSTDGGEGQLARPLHPNRKPHSTHLYTKKYLFCTMRDDDNIYKTLRMNTQEKEGIRNLVKSLASEERIGIDEHVYRGNRAYDRWCINPFQLFEFLKQILINPEIKRKEVHNASYFPMRYLCESELNNFTYPCIIGINESDQGFVIVITLLNRKKTQNKQR